MQSKRHSIIMPSATTKKISCSWEKGNLKRQDRKDGNAKN